MGDPFKTYKGEEIRKILETRNKTEYKEGFMIFVKKKKNFEFYIFWVF